MCDEIAIINHGELIVRDTTSNLLSKLDCKTLVITPSVAAEAIDAPDGVSVDIDADGRLRLSYRPANVSDNDVLDLIRKAGIIIKDIQTDVPDLEDVFLSLTE